jgi:hypothetical protein
LSAKKIVGLLVLNKLKIIADDFFNAEKYPEALKEYEKLFSINPKDNYVEHRIKVCNDIINGNKRGDYTEQKLNFVFRGVEKKKNSSIKLYLDNQLIGETNITKGFQFKYTDTKPGAYALRVVWATHEWSGIINTALQTNFKFEYKNEKTGFGYKSYFELVK